MGLLEQRRLAADRLRNESAYAGNMAHAGENIQSNVARNAMREAASTHVPSGLQNAMMAKEMVGDVSALKSGAGNASTLVSRFPKLKAMLALAGPAALGLTAFGAGQKAMAGDIPGAGMDVADAATDYIPGVGEAKMALSSPELGKGSDEVKDKEQFDFAPYKTEQAEPENMTNEPSKFRKLSGMLGKARLQQNY